MVQRGGLSSVNVLSSICAGYLEGTQPPVCNCVAATPDQVLACVQSGDFRPPSAKVCEKGHEGRMFARLPCAFAYIPIYGSDSIPPCLLAGWLPACPPNSPTTHTCTSSNR